MGRDASVISRIFRVIGARLLPTEPFDGTSPHKGLWERWTRAQPQRGGVTASRATSAAR